MGSFAIAPKLDISLDFVCLHVLVGTLGDSVVDGLVYECPEQGFGHGVITTDSGADRLTGAGDLY